MVKPLRVTVPVLGKLTQLPWFAVTLIVPPAVPAVTVMLFPVSAVGVQVVGKVQVYDAAPATGEMV
jgi:hypothetical protein